MISYQTHARDILPEQLAGFFEGWPNPPSLETHLQLLRNSSNVVLAIDTDTCHVVGFVTAISDQVLSAYIPLLEVLPSFRHQGIGHELMRQILIQFENLYMVDLMCDPGLQPFYESLGMVRGLGMTRRNYAAQSGRSPQR